MPPLKSKKPNKLNKLYKVHKPRNHRVFILFQVCWFLYPPYTIVEWSYKWVFTLKFLSYHAGLISSHMPILTDVLLNNQVDKS